MVVLFVHGMGRTSVSGWPMLRRLRSAGYHTETFGYRVSGESFGQIVSRLATRLAGLLAQQEVVLIGHSLGGVLLREAVSLLECPGRPSRLFLLGSPLQASRMAARLSRNLVFRAVTNDCGQLLASRERMAAVGVPLIPMTGIAGTRGVIGLGGPFGTEPNDSVVSLSEVSAPWLTDQMLVPVVHTFLPSSHRVTEVVLERLRRCET